MSVSTATPPLRTSTQRHPRVEAAWMVWTLTLALATTWCVLGAGTTSNDLTMTLCVVGSFVVEGMIGWGLIRSGWPASFRILGMMVIAAGMMAQHLFFLVLNLRGDPGNGLLYAWMEASQPAFGFAFWAGLLLAMRFALRLPRLLRRPGPGILAPILAPGPWLGLPLVLGLGAWAWVVVKGDQVRTLDLREEASSEPPSLRLVHLSDLHYGPSFPRERLDALMDRVGALSPDLVVLSGDLLMPYSEHRHDGLIEGLARLPAPVVACAGNHDLAVADELDREMNGFGLHLLRNESVLLTTPRASVEIVGLDMGTNPNKAILDRIPFIEADLHLLVMHDPSRFSPIRAGRFDLILSGHTHGGMVALNPLGIRWSPWRWLVGPDNGLFEDKGRRLLVHSGNAWLSLPPRMGTAPELWVVEL